MNPANLVSDVVGWLASFGTFAIVAALISAAAICPFALKYIFTSGEMAERTQAEKLVGAVTTVVLTFLFLLLLWSYVIRAFGPANVSRYGEGARPHPNFAANRDA